MQELRERLCWAYKTAQQVVDEKSNSISITMIKKSNVHINKMMT